MVGVYSLTSTSALNRIRLPTVRTVTGPDDLIHNASISTTYLLRSNRSGWSTVDRARSWAPLRPDHPNPGLLVSVVVQCQGPQIPTARKPLAQNPSAAAYDTCQTGRPRTAHNPVVSLAYLGTMSPGLEENPFPGQLPSLKSQYRWRSSGSLPGVRIRTLAYHPIRYQPGL